MSIITSRSKRLKAGSGKRDKTLSEAIDEQIEVAKNSLKEAAAKLEKTIKGLEFSTGDTFQLADRQQIKHELNGIAHAVGNVNAFLRKPPKLKKDE